MTLPGLLVGIAAAQQVEQEPHRGAGLIRAAVLAVEAIGQDQPLESVRGEAPVKKFSERPGQEAGHRGDLVATDTAEAAIEPPHLGQPSRTPAEQVGWWLEKKRLQVGGQLQQLGFGLEEGVYVGGRKALHLFAHASCVGPPACDSAVFERGLHARVAGNHPQTVRTELEIAYYRRPQHAGDVGRGRDPAARGQFRVYFFGDGAAAHGIAALDNQDALAGPGEVGSGGQAVVTGADDYDVVLHTGMRAV